MLVGTGHGVPVCNAALEDRGKGLGVQSSVAVTQQTEGPGWLHGRSLSAQEAEALAWPCA